MELEKEMSLDEYKTHIKDMLGFVHKICVENNIRYFVAYGTLLGTVRHNGFIPWDDDIDIWMIGEDYDRFVKVMSEKSADYYVLGAENSKNYYNLMSRICSKAGTLKLNGIIDIEELGPFIDIFHMYKAPVDAEERKKYFLKLKRMNAYIRYSLPCKLYKSLSRKRRSRMLLFLPVRIICRYLIGTRKLKEMRSKLVKKYEGYDTGLYYTIGERHFSDKNLMRADLINEVEEHIFEDIQVLIPSRYHDILTCYYGDYMQLPPEEKRASHHHFTPYWK